MGEEQLATRRVSAAPEAGGATPVEVGSSPAPRGLALTWGLVARRTKATLEFHGGVVAAFWYAAWSVPAIAVLIGLLSWFSVEINGRTPTLGDRAAASLCCLLVMLPIALLLVLLAPPRVRLDRRAGTVRAGVLWRSRRLPLADVRAVQMLCYWNRGDVYQINLVVGTTRVLVCEAVLAERAVSLGGEVAEFLGVPLLNQTSHGPDARAVTAKARPR
jgi:hypothetical protein